MFGRKKRSEVLVVGAGPVGLITALLLDREGVDVQIIDQAWRAAGRSYAAALHPSTLALLDDLGIAKAVLAEAHRVDAVAFYDGKHRHAKVDFGKLPGRYPCVVVLPQSTLESMLEERLRQRGRTVQWLHRLSGFQQETDRVVAEVEVLESVSGGYAVAMQGTQVSHALDVECSFLVGADGHHSFVRRALGVEYESWGQVETYDVFEFESDDDAAGEARIAIDETTTNVLWTLPNGRQRWSFQVVGVDSPDRERVKSRLMMAVPGESSPRFTGELLHKMMRERAPWFRRKVGDIAWAGEVSFEPRLAKRLGQRRVWLVGDAVHQTGPIGVQSMNAGLLEARKLVAAMREALRTGAVEEGLTSYQDVCVPAWCRMLGIQELFTAEGGSAGDWVARRLDRIVPCLPASGEDLVLLGRQLGCRVVGAD